MKELTVPAYMPNLTELYEYSQKSGTAAVAAAFELLKSIKYRMYLASFIRNNFQPVTRTNYDVEDLLFDCFGRMNIGSSADTFFHDLRKLNTAAARAVYESIEAVRPAKFERFIRTKIGMPPPGTKYFNIETYAVEKRLIGWNVITGGVPLVKIPNPCVVQELVSSICLSEGFRPKLKRTYFFFFDDFCGFFVELKTEAECDSFIKLCKCNGKPVLCVW